MSNCSTVRYFGGHFSWIHKRQDPRPTIVNSRVGPARGGADGGSLQGQPIRPPRRHHGRGRLSARPASVRGARSAMASVRSSSPTRGTTPGRCRRGSGIETFSARRDTRNWRRTGLGISGGSERHRRDERLPHARGQALRRPARPHQSADAHPRICADGASCLGLLRVCKNPARVPQGWRRGDRGPFDQAHESWLRL
jgi:hypothetical protein